jgi:hypothetical protein
VTLRILKEHDMSEVFCYERLSPAAFAILQDAARERAVRLREEAIGAAASWLARAFADAAGRLAGRVRRRRRIGRPFGSPHEAAMTTFRPMDQPPTAGSKVQQT